MVEFGVKPKLRGRAKRNLSGNDDEIEEQPLDRSVLIGLSSVSESVERMGDGD